MDLHRGAAAVVVLVVCAGCCLALPPAEAPSVHSACTPEAVTDGRMVQCEGAPAVADGRWFLAYSQSSGDAEWPTFNPIAMHLGPVAKVRVTTVAGEVSVLPVNPAWSTLHDLLYSQPWVLTDTADDDAYKFVAGAHNATFTQKLLLVDDDDPSGDFASGCEPCVGRQTAQPGTPYGVLTFGVVDDVSVADFGACCWGASRLGPSAVARLEVELACGTACQAVGHTCHYQCRSGFMRAGGVAQRTCDNRRGWLGGHALACVPALGGCANHTDAEVRGLAVGGGVGWHSPAAWPGFAVPPNGKCTALSSMQVACAHVSGLVVHRGVARVQGQLVVSPDAATAEASLHCTPPATAACVDTPQRSTTVPSLETVWDFAGAWRDHQLPSARTCTVVDVDTNMAVRRATVGDVVVFGSTLRVTDTLVVDNLAAAQDTDPDGQPAATGVATVPGVPDAQWFSTLLWEGFKPPRHRDFATVADATEIVTKCAYARGMQLQASALRVTPGGHVAVGPGAAGFECPIDTCPPLVDVEAGACTGREFADYCTLPPRPDAGWPWDQLAAPVLVCHNARWLLGDALPSLPGVYTDLHATPSGQRPSDQTLQPVFDHVRFHGGVGQVQQPFPRDPPLVEGWCAIDGELYLPCDRHPTAGDCLVCDPRVAPSAWSSVCGDAACAADAWVAPDGSVQAARLVADAAAPDVVTPLSAPASCPAAVDDCTLRSSVAGVVRKAAGPDGTPGEPLAGQRVDIETSTVLGTAYTTDAGRFVFTLPPGPYVVTLWQSPITARRYNVTLAATGMDLTLD